MFENLKYGQILSKDVLDNENGSDLLEQPNESSTLQEDNGIECGESQKGLDIFHCTTSSATM